jgi:hypothetical protein
MTASATTAPSAAHVSKTLAAAGMTRASKYSIWGRTTEGFIVLAAKSQPEVRVTFSDRLHAAAECDQAVAVLTAAGYVATPQANNGLGGSYWITVTPS